MLEEMPPFPERESSILAKLKKKKQEKTGIVEKEDKPEPVGEADHQRTSSSC